MGRKNKRKNYDSEKDFEKFVRRSMEFNSKLNTPKESESSGDSNSDTIKENKVKEELLARINKLQNKCSSLKKELEIKDTEFAMSKRFKTERSSILKTVGVAAVVGAAVATSINYLCNKTTTHDESTSSFINGTSEEEYNNDVIDEIASEYSSNDSSNDGGEVI